MNLLSRLKGATAVEPERMTLDDYATMLNFFQYGGARYPVGVQEHISQTLGVGEATEKPSNDFEGLARQAYEANGPIFACMLVRMLVFSSIQFRWQRIVDGASQDMFGTRDLQVLNTPWPGGTTQDLLSRIENDASLAGNSFWVRDRDELVRLRPDWVLIAASPRRMNQGRNAGRGPGQVGWVKKGYIYTEGGGTPDINDSVVFTADEVAHFAPIPDPMGTFTGMSWLSPIISEIRGDHAMTRHQRAFFDNGATPNMIVKHDPSATIDAIKRFAEELEDKFAGAANAYKTLHLYPGADATVVGVDLQRADMTALRSGGESRIAAAAGVPPVIAGFMVGIEAATYSNYSQARRRFADATIRPLWQNVCGSLQPIMNLPQKGTPARLWYETGDVAFLREDEKDVAEIAQTQAQTINIYVTAGFEPESVVKAVMANDLRFLKDTGYRSVQLQKPGATEPGKAEPEKKPEPANNGRALELVNEQLREAIAITASMEESK